MSQTPTTTDSHSQHQGALTDFDYEQHAVERPDDRITTSIDSAESLFNSDIGDVLWIDGDEFVIVGRGQSLIAPSPLIVAGENGEQGALVGGKLPHSETVGVAWITDIKNKDSDEISRSDTICTIDAVYRLEQNSLEHVHLWTPDTDQRTCPECGESTGWPLRIERRSSDAVEIRRCTNTDCHHVYRFIRPFPEPEEVGILTYDDNDDAPSVEMIDGVFTAEDQDDFKLPIETHKGIDDGFYSTREIADFVNMKIVGGPISEQLSHDKTDVPTIVDVALDHFDFTTVTPRSFTPLERLVDSDVLTSAKRRYILEETPDDLDFYDVAPSAFLERLFDNADIDESLSYQDVVSTTFDVDRSHDLYPEIDHLSHMFADDFDDRFDLDDDLAKEIPKTGGAMFFDWLQRTRLLHSCTDSAELKTALQTTSENTISEDDLWFVDVISAVFSEENIEQTQQELLEAKDPDSLAIEEVDVEAFMTILLNELDDDLPSPDYLSDLEGLVPDDVIDVAKRAVIDADHPYDLVCSPGFFEILTDYTTLGNHGVVSVSDSRTSDTVVEWRDAPGFKKKMRVTYSSMELQDTFDIPYRFSMQGNPLNWLFDVEQFED